MIDEVPASVRTFINELTSEADGELSLRAVETAYIVHCEVAGYEPEAIVDVRQFIEKAGVETVPEAVNGRQWDGLEALLEDNPDAVRRVVADYDPNNPDRPVPPRERHVHEVAEQWRASDRGPSDVEVSLQ